MARILITGGAGFIGSHLCRVLTERGDEVICLDNLITGFRKNIESLIDTGNFTFIEHDISQPLYLDQDIDWVFHFASLASPKH
ncbi:MAG: NAD-dependent epimerase/dehydratase family protein, partial [Candidatus Omnitrophica bacterium]|nr:NAD-dependent epimerase/dehydratase family protein [Candidatus Omnitrophota bacterium]